MQYVIHQRNSLLSRDIEIEDQHGKVVFRAHGPVVRMRDELRLDDAQGVEQAWIKDLVLSDGTKYEIHRAGARYADVNRIVEGELFAGCDICLVDGECMPVRGDLVGRNFTIMSHGMLAAQVKKRHGDALEVKVEHKDEVLMLAGVIAIIAMLNIWARARTHH